MLYPFAIENTVIEFQFINAIYKNSFMGATRYTQHISGPCDPPFVSLPERKKTSLNWPGPSLYKKIVERESFYPCYQNSKSTPRKMHSKVDVEDPYKREVMFFFSLNHLVFFFLLLLFFASK